jgi:hypothetical protein
MDKVMALHKEIDWIRSLAKCVSEEFWSFG